MTPSDLQRAAACLAVDPMGLAGAWLDVGSPSAGESWLAALGALLEPGTPQRRLPATTSEDRLLGGLDLARTLAHGRPALERGIVAECDGGVLALTGAERAPRALVAHLAQALDAGEVRIERDGFHASHAARVAVVAIAERGDDTVAPTAASLVERVALSLRVDDATPAPDAALVDRVRRARERAAAVRTSDDDARALCEAALSVGVASVRAPLMALRVARASAALDGRDEVGADDLACAARLVLAARATCMPDSASDVVAPPPESADSGTDADDAPAPGTLPRDVVIDAVRAALPPEVLAALAARDAGSLDAAQGRARDGGREALRGRAIGARAGMPRGGRRLHLLDTLRAAAPWQRLRAPHDGGGDRRTVRVRPADLRVRRHVAPRATTTIVLVDASGSQALDRLAEAKGCVELLLAESYRRRDRVALLAFRGTTAELLLPPTRALARARRTVAALPGGGGTPLAAGLDAATRMVESVRREGGAPVVVLITDGRANVARDGTAGRERAHADALDAARALARRLGEGAGRVAALLVDTSRRGDALARELARSMGARYEPLPDGDAPRVARAAIAVRDDRRMPAR